MNNLLRFVSLSLVLLAACNGNSGGKDIIVTTGFEPATQGNVIYVPEDIDTTLPPAEYEPKFGEPGRAFKMWAGVAPPYDIPVANGNAEVRHKLTIKLHMDTPENITRACIGLGSPSNVIACTIPDRDGVCEVYVSPEHNDYVWGHELWHCIDGYYHG